MIIGQVLRNAIGRGEAEHDVTFNIKGAMSPRKQKHYAAVTTPKDIADLLVRMECYHGSPMVRAAPLFSLFTFQRPGEIRAAASAEMDLESPLWRIPAERMKNRSGP